VPSVSVAQQPTATISEANMIETIQRFLQQLGYNPGPVDGIMGKKTAAAIKIFQQDMNLPVDGNPSAELLEFLEKEITKRSGPTATISAVSGTVLVNGQEQEEGTILIAGDVIETQAEASMVLEFSDGSQLELGENTKLDIAELSQTATGVRVSRVKMAWGWLRAKLSPGHQQAGSSFDIETPNALVGMKFSQPDVEVSYDPAKEETIAIAHTVNLVVKNLLTGETVLVPVGATAIITALGIEVLSRIADAETIAAESAGAEPTETEPTEIEPTEIEPTGAETTAGKAATGISRGKMIAIGAGALVVVGGVAALAGGGSSPTEPQSLNLSGTWSGNASDSSGPGRMTWRLTQTGNTIRGTVTGTDIRGGVPGNGTISGTLSGATLTFTINISDFPAPYTNCLVIINGTGTVKNNATIEGAYSGTNSCFGPFTNGWFLLTRQ